MEGYIAVYEIVSFESFVSNNETDTRLQLYRKLSENIYREIFPLDKAKERLTDKLHFRGYDKYFVLWTEEKTPRAFGDILNKCQIAIATALVEGFPLRGCIHSGEVPDFRRHINHILTAKTLLGLSTGFREAIELLEINPMIGSFVTAHTLESFEDSRTKNTATISDFIKLKVLVEVPFEGLSQKPIALNWLANSDFNPPIEQLIFIFQKHNKEITEEIEKILQNTRTFISVVQAPQLN